MSMNTTGMSLNEPITDNCVEHFPLGNHQHNGGGKKNKMLNRTNFRSSQIASREVPLRSQVMEA